VESQTSKQSPGEATEFLLIHASFMKKIRLKSAFGFAKNVFHIVIRVLWLHNSATPKRYVDTLGRQTMSWAGNTVSVFSPTFPPKCDGLN
jgi:hypothetical protein